MDSNTPPRIGTPADTQPNPNPNINPNTNPNRGEGWGGFCAAKLIEIYDGSRLNPLWPH